MGPTDSKAIGWKQYWLSYYYYLLLLLLLLLLSRVVAPADERV